MQELGVLLNRVGGSPLQYWGMWQGNPCDLIMHDCLYKTSKEISVSHMNGKQMVLVPL